MRATLKGRRQVEGRADTERSGRHLINRTKRMSVSDVYARVTCAGESVTDIDEHLLADGSECAAWNEVLRCALNRELIRRAKECTCRRTNAM